MIRKFKIINPGKPSGSAFKKKRKRKKGFRRSNKKQIHKKLIGSSIMYHKKRGRKRSSNPVRSRGRKPGGFFKKKHRRRRNPEGTMLSGSNLMGAGAGIFGGVLAFKFATGLLQTEGNGKYLTGAILAVIGWWGLGKIYKPMALPFAIAVGAITVNEYLNDSGLLDGIIPNSGWSDTDINALQDWQQNYALSGANGLGLVPGVNGLVPNDINLNNDAAYAGINGASTN